MIRDATSRAFFDGIYQRDSDPWNFASSAYELGRYERILQAFSPMRYKYSSEPGCSIGVLTERLASICDRVKAMDIFRIAVDRARQRCSGLEDVHIECATMPDNVSAGVRFDRVERDRVLLQ
jgi:Nodulation protein S (NodS)